VRAIIASCLLGSLALLSGCVVSVSGSGWGGSDPWGGTPAERSKAQIKMLDNAKAGLITLRQSIDKSVPGQLCKLAAGPASDEDLVKAASLVKGRYLDSMAALIQTKGMRDFFANPVIRAGLAAQPVPDATYTSLKDVALEIDANTDPAAAATYAPDIGAHINMSIGLIARVCATNDTSALIDEALKTIERRRTARDTADSEDDALMSAAGGLLDVAMIQFELQLFMRNIDLAMLFVTSHELSHVTFDRDPNAGTPVRREIRADIVGYVLVEMTSGDDKAKGAASTVFAQKLSWRTTKMDEIVRIASTEGYETVFDQVYKSAGMTEANAEHLSIDDRIKGLNSFAKLLTDPTPRK